MTASGCDRKTEPVGEHIYFQNSNCLIMGRGEKSYDFGPAEYTYRFFLLCRQGADGDYRSDEFLLKQSTDDIRISSSDSKIVNIEYCPNTTQTNPAELSLRLSTILSQYPVEQLLDFNINENLLLCPEILQ